MFPSLVPLGDPLIFRIKYENYGYLSSGESSGGVTLLTPPPLPEYAPVYVKYIIHAYIPQQYFGNNHFHTCEK